VPGGFPLETGFLMAKRPRTFAAIDPEKVARFERIETFTTNQIEINLAEDRDEPGDWRVEYFDPEDWRAEYFDAKPGARCVTIFAGPWAAHRARDYFEALKNGQLAIIRDDSSD
jgi:hypothetical protein